MSKFDQRNQKVDKQYNINISQSEEHTAATLLERGIKLIGAHEYELAIQNISRAIEIEPLIADAQYYLALALLHGQRPRLLKLATIKEVQDRLAVAAKQASDCSHVYILWAIVKEDYYTLNKLQSMPPSPQDLVKRVKTIRVTHLNEMLAHVAAPKNRIWEWLRTLR